MKRIIFRGTCTALVTPFHNGQIDYVALKNLIEFQISQGVDALLINGTTGESATLSDIEKRELISFAVREVGGRVPLIAGTGSNDTKTAISLSEYACEVGANAVLVVTPYYNKASDDGLIYHYEAIASRINIPLILYNVPSRTGVNIHIGVYQRLGNNENIVAVKEANPSMTDFARLSCHCKDSLALYSGNDDLIVPTLSLGGSGIISVLSNALPREVSKICRLWFEGKTDEATVLQLKLIPLINTIFSEVNPIPIKALLSHLGLCHEEYRLPLCKMEGKKREILLDAFNKLK